MPINEIDKIEIGDIVTTNINNEDFVFIISSIENGVITFNSVNGKEPKVIIGDIFKKHLNKQ